MLRNIFVLFFVIFVTVQTSKAQSKSGRSAISLRSISNIGLINGTKGPSVSLQTILGASLKGSFAGLGIGIDYYRFRSIPVFLDVRHEFGNGPRNFFIYGDIGYNYDWLAEKNKDDIYSAFSNYKGGIYYDGGIGFKVSFKNRDAFLISAGYSVKKIGNTIDLAYCSLVDPCNRGKDNYIYTMQRLIIKAGWSF